MTDKPLGINMNEVIFPPSQQNTVWPSFVKGTIAAFTKSMTGCTKTRAVEIAEEVFNDHKYEDATPMGYMVMVEEAMTKAMLTENADN